MLIFQVESHGEPRFDSKESWHLVRQLKRGFQEQWAPLISQLLLIFTRKMERFCWERVFPGMRGLLDTAVLHYFLFWGRNYRCKTLWIRRPWSLSALDSFSTHSAIQVSVLNFLWILAQNSTLHPFHQPQPWPLSELSSWPEQIWSLEIVHSENLKIQAIELHWKECLDWIFHIISSVLTTWWHFI